MLGIMQPYYLPYWGHFSLISQTDFWVVFDITQYTPKTWINRNKIIHPSKEWQYLTVSLSNSSIHIKINQAKILFPENTLAEHLQKLKIYERKAPFYNDVIDLFIKSFDELKSNYLVDLNIIFIKNICSYLNIQFNYLKASDLDISYPNVIKPGDWALIICEKLGYRDYLNPLSGRKIFSSEKFNRHKVNLFFHDAKNFIYERGNYNFSGNLSIIDTMMWINPSIIKRTLYSNATIINSKNI